MRTLHVGLRIEDLERSLAFYTSVGYEVVGTVPETELGSLTMLALPGDEFVALELVHDPTQGRVDPAASATSSFRSKTCTRRWRTWLHEESRPKRPVRPTAPQTSGRHGSPTRTVTASSSSSGPMGIPTA
jgi:catechol 2,3-dioxygenase-like lactoylglutathione lyase family enzyme